MKTRLERFEGQTLNRKLIEKLSKEPKAKEFEKFLYTHPLPEVDFVIRTSGEERISNFLLYQSAYAEFHFVNVLWPDFDEEQLYASLAEFQKRNRRYGGIK